MIVKGNQQFNISPKQAEVFAFAILPDIAGYIEQNQAEYILFLSEQIDEAAVKEYEAYKQKGGNVCK